MCKKPYKCNQCDYSVTHKATVTFNAARVPATETDPQVLIDLSALGDPFWNSVDNGGGNIRCKESGGTTAIPRQVIFCNTSNRTGYIWGKPASVSALTNTPIEIHVEDGASEPAFTDTSNGRNAVWPQYDRIYHLNDLLDSTGNVDLTASGAPTLGNDTSFPGGLGTIFDGLDDYLSAAGQDYGTIDSTRQIWVKGDSNAAGAIFMQGDAGTNGKWHGIRRNGSGDLITAVDDGTNIVFNSPSPAFSLAGGNWVQITVVIDHGNISEVFVDGVSRGAADISSIGDIHDAGSLYIGARLNNAATDLPWDDSLAELRMRTGTVTADRVLFDYRTINDAGAGANPFYSVTDIFSGTPLLSNCLAANIAADRITPQVDVNF